jgi:hypothetical protein
MHAAVVQSIEKLHGASPSYKSLFEHVGLARGAEDMPRVWEKAERLQTLLAFDLGAGGRDGRQGRRPHRRGETRARELQGQFSNAIRG